MTSYKLKYLYRAIYKDGSKYDQSTEDISVADPNKSCYHDLKLDQIRYFILSDGKSSYSLDLDHGSVSVNGGNPFYLFTEEAYKLKLVYFRRVILETGNIGGPTTVNYVLGCQGESYMGLTIYNTIVIR